MKLNSIILFIFIFFHYSCKNPSASESKAIKEETTVEVTKESSNPIIYTSFDQLEKQILQPSDSTLIINFWATWCKPCVAELPHFNELSNELKDKKVKFLFVSLDFINTMDKSLLPFLKANPLNGTVILLGDQDVNSWADKVDKKWDGAIPVTMVIKGNQKTAKLGSFKDLEDLKLFIQPYL